MADLASREAWPRFDFMNFIAQFMRLKRGRREMTAPTFFLLVLAVTLGVTLGRAVSFRLEAKLSVRRLNRSIRRRILLARLDSERQPDEPRASAGEIR